MIRSLYVAASGMAAQQTYIDVTSNNIANVNTTGFKRVRANFQDLMYQTMRAPGAQVAQDVLAPTGTEVGLGTRLVNTQRLFSTGSLKPTERPLDVAIEGNGFLQVTMPDGTISYTRDGALTTDQNGLLVTGQGYALEPSITIPEGAVSVTIGKSGIVSVEVDGQAEPVEVGQLQLAGFINPAGLRSRGGNLYFETAASGAPVVGNPGESGLGSLQAGWLEMANVKVVEEMINLIAAQRAFEINGKAIKASDEMLAEVARLR